MKKLFLATVILVSGFVFSQKSALKQTYNYSGKNDKVMVKAKTDLFLLDVLASNRFTMNHISSGDSHLELQLNMPVKEGNISSKVRYNFLKTGVEVSLSDTQMLLKNNTVILINNEKDKNHQQIMNGLINLLFNTYRQQIFG